MDFLDGLNPPQRQAVAHAQGPLLILAGAGSGKTRVITHRIAHLIHAHRVPPSSIVAVTFTNKAADEMKQRVARLLGGGYPLGGLTVSTFHSFAVRLLRRDGQGLAAVRPGFTRSFSIYDEDDQAAVVKAVYRQLGLKEKEFMPYRAALSHISFAKNRNQTPQDLYKEATDPKANKFAVVYDHYDGRLRQANALDFDDLLLEAVRLLRHDDATRRTYNARIVHLLIDEYQDTNRSQYELMRLLTETHRNVCVVGDEDQSIYSWRGADIRNILDFQKDYPDVTTIRLEQNYRSTKTILEAASTVVAHNTERIGKWLWTDSGGGEPIGLYQGHDGENEALFVADTIERVLRKDPGTRIAILYRTNFQSRQFEEALRRYGRRYHVIGGFSFYQRAEIKDVLSYLKALIAPQDSISLLRIINTPARGIGNTTVEQIEVYARERGLSLWAGLEQLLKEDALSTRARAALESFHRLIEDLRRDSEGAPLDAVIRMILERTGYLKVLESEDTPQSESRRENLKELANAAADAAERGEGILEFLDHAALVSETDDLDVTAQVSLLTLHNAKGLEFPVVFITGLEENLFPHSRSRDSAAGLEEERRLFYVGMTRAQKRLFLSWAQFRRRYATGQPEQTIASRFLSEVPEQLVRELGPAGTASQVDLAAERYLVRDAVRRNMYTGKTYNSLENIAEFFEARKLKPPPPPAQAKPVAPLPRKPAPKPKQGVGATINHPRYGRGTVVRREGEGEFAKITVSFPGYGLKKLVERYALRSDDEHEERHR